MPARVPPPPAPCSSQRGGLLLLLLLHEEGPLRCLPSQLTVDCTHPLHTRLPCSFQRDGLLLLHREGHYWPGEGTPLALLWKDAASSRYFIDTDAAGGWVLDSCGFTGFRKVGSGQRGAAVEGRRHSQQPLLH